MEPIKDYLAHGILPEDEIEARKIRIKAPSFAIRQGVLYKKGYLMPWLRCLDSEEANYVLEENHEGICGAHSGAKTLAKKVIRLGYFWPTIYKDAQALTKRCMECQQHAPIPHLPATTMTSISSPWPFHQWGVDLVGPFPEAPGKVKFLIVAVDYFTKWVEAEPLATITGKNVVKFFWKNIISRFGITHTIVSDNGKQFAENPFKQWCIDMKIDQKFTSVAHPQANGQTEVTNKTILKGLKTRLGRAKGLWVDELPSVLWTYRTTARTATNETPFSLTYGSEAVLPLEIGLPTDRVLHFNEEETETDMRANLDLLQERREVAALRQATYKSQTEKYYNRRVKERACKVGDLVLRKNEASRAENQGKLSQNWEGPYKVVEAHLNGSYVLETLQGTPIPRTWNIANLKKYHL